MIRQAEIQDVREGIERYSYRSKSTNLRLFAIQSRGLPVQMYKQGVLEIKDCKHNKQGNKVRKEEI